MNFKNKFLTILLLMAPFVMTAQSTDAWRNKNWKHNKGKYFFNKVLTWRYMNEMSEDPDFQKGVEIRIYVDEKTGTFLFTPEAYVNSGPMIDFVIGDRDGNYIVGYSLEHDGFGRENYVLEDVRKLRNDPQIADSKFSEFFRATGKKNVFGENDYGWATLTGDEYKIVFEELEQEEPTVVNIASMPYSFLPLYLFRNLEIEADLPFHFDYGGMIPDNHILLSEYNNHHDFKEELIFDSYSFTEYYIDLKKYKKMKQ